MVLQTAAKTLVTLTSLAFLSGLAAGAAMVGGACAARAAMNRRKSWSDDTAMSPTLPMDTPNPL